MRELKASPESRAVPRAGRGQREAETSLGQTCWEQAPSHTWDGLGSDCPHPTQRGTERTLRVEDLRVLEGSVLSSFLKPSTWLPLKPSLVPPQASVPEAGRDPCPHQVGQGALEERPSELTLGFGAQSHGGKLTLQGERLREEVRTQKP